VLLVGGRHAVPVSRDSPERAEAKERPSRNKSHRRAFDRRVLRRRRPRELSEGA